MKTPPRFLSLALGLLAFTVCAQAAQDLARKKILFFSKSSGYEHDAIKLQRQNGQPGYAFAVLKELGEKNNIDFTFSKDGSLFSPEYLAQFDAFMFYTTGDLTEAGTDKYPPMTPAGRAAFFKAIADGKGFVGIHSAADTFHSPDNKFDNTPGRYVSDGEKADEYVRTLGGEFIKHDAQQPARQIVADKNFPGMASVPDDFGPAEEWYSLKNFAPDMHVLLVQDTSKMKGASYERAPYPSTWARMQGKGRVFYTSMGHRDDVWTNPVFQNVLVNGINWATHRVDADVKPNLMAVAPQANALPKFPPPPAPRAPAAPAAPAPTAPAPASAK